MNLNDLNRSLELIERRSGVNMRKNSALYAIVMIFGFSGPAWAECSVSSDTGAAVKQLDMTVKADANIVASMSLLPKLMHIEYSNEARKKPSCDLGEFTADSASYRLYGDERSQQRIAKPAHRGSPIAEIVPVTNLMKAIDASKQGKSAPVEGYLLATVSKREFTGWRYYTGMPDPTVLKHDMSEILGGGATPIFRNGADGKTTIFMR